MNIKKLKNGFSSYQLHLFAMIFMLIDHIGNSLLPFNFILRYIGRISFPIFCFLLVNGFFKSNDKLRYFKRLCIFAILSEIPFDLLFSNMMLDFSSQNVLWTFCISFIMMYCLEVSKKRYFVFFPIIVFIFSFIAFIIKSDYSFYGVLMVFVFYFTYNFSRKTRFIFQLLCMTIINGILFKGFCVKYGILMIYSQPFAILSLLFIWLYNGELGRKNKYIKYFNYLFYPIHLIILWLLNLVL